MDCRHWICLGLVGLLAGCTHQSGSISPTLASAPTLSPPPEAQPNPDVTPEKELPKRQPKPHTCVVLGDLKEKEALACKSPVQAEILYDQARKLYQQALDIDPQNLEALQSLAKHYVTIKDHDRAIATFQTAIKAHPEESALRFDLGMYHSQCKEWDPAIENLRQAVASEPENRLFSNTLGFCLARAGRYEESLACFAQTVGPAKAHYNVARMMVHMNQVDKGKEHLRLAVQADPSLADARQMLAQLDGPAKPGVTLSLDPAVDQ